MNYYRSFQNSAGETIITIVVSEVRRFSLEWTNRYVIYTLLNGNINFYSDGNETDMSAGDLILINPNTPFSTLSDKKGRYCLAVLLSSNLFAKYKDSEHSLLFNIKTSAHNKNEPKYCMLRAIISRLMLYGLSDKQSDIACFGGYMHLLAGSLISGFSYDTLPKIKVQQEINGLFTFETMLSFIEKNFNENINLSDVARVGNYNPNYVSQFFKCKAGINFYEFLTRVRLRYAISKINNTDLSFTEIASQSGFPSSKALSRSFTQYYGLSPSDYRSRIRSGEYAMHRTPTYNIGGNFTNTIAHPFSATISNERTDEIDSFLLSFANGSDFHIDAI